MSGLRASGWLRACGCEAAGNALCDVDTAGDVYRELYWDNSVLPDARPDADAVPEMQQTFGAIVYFLSALRRGIDADLPRVSQEAWGGMVELCLLRDAGDGAGWQFDADGLEGLILKTPGLRGSGVFAFWTGGRLEEFGGKVSGRPVSKFRDGAP